MNKIKLYFVANQCSFIVSHRLDLLLEAQREGYDVNVLVGNSPNESLEKPALELLLKKGITVKTLNFRPTGLNPIMELLGFFQILLLLKSEKPEIIHTVSPKGMLYGGLAARLCRVKGLVIAVSGMGYLYTGAGGVIRRMLTSALKYITNFILGHPNLKIIVQNQDDLRYFAKRVSTKSIVLIQGSGVDLSKYKNVKAEGQKMVLFPARLLKDKGIFEFINAAAKLKTNFDSWRFVLAGAITDNPTSISQTELDNWLKEGTVEWYGQVNNMIPVFEESSIVCLPSYREGMPKSLLEAAAAGRAVVTTDVIGCRESIINGKTGLLVEPQNVDSLVAGLTNLMLDAEKRNSFGKAGTELANSKFSIISVIKKTLKIYKIVGNGSER